MANVGTLTMHLPHRPRLNSVCLVVMPDTFLGAPVLSIEVVSYGAPIVPYHMPESLAVPSGIIVLWGTWEALKSSPL